MTASPLQRLFGMEYNMFCPYCNNSFSCNIDRSIFCTVCGKLVFGVKDHIEFMSTINQIELEHEFYEKNREAL